MSSVGIHIMDLSPPCVLTREGIIVWNWTATHSDLSHAKQSGLFPFKRETQGKRDITSEKTLFS